MMVFYGNLDKFVTWTELSYDNNSGVCSLVYVLLSMSGWNSVYTVLFTASNWIRLINSVSLIVQFWFLSIYHD